MAWALLKIQANSQNADVLSDSLMSLGALSVSIEDAHAESSAEQAIFGEPGDPPPGLWHENIVSAMFELETNIEDVIERLKLATSSASFNYAVESIADQDWVRATQAQFDPIKINDRLWIVPTWHERPNNQAINISLDPGLAFGTGSHPTTHLCLDWLTQQTDLTSVLDYGCGSGILAIAAKKLGAQKVVGTDIDQQAIIASEFNASQNQEKIDFFSADTFKPKAFDFVVANILSSALMVLAPVLAAACNTRGKIALSGILESQAETLATRYGEWFNMALPTQKDGWILLTGTKK